MSNRRCGASLDVCSETEAPSDQRSVDTVIDVSAGRLAGRLLSLVYSTTVRVSSPSYRSQSYAGRVRCRR